MTDRVDLEAIRTRADAATPGPWRTWNDGHVGAPAAHIGGIFMPTNCADHAQWMPDATFAAHAREDVPALVAELAVLRAQRDAALAACDAAVAEHDHAATEATARDADSPAAASARGRAGGVYLAAEVVRAALGVQPEPADD